ncbi:hypothetical protein HX785_25335 [Pseudomonas reactans]|uniref:AbiTii domain-containing protein n=1 Tax=Pseudomonas reactans TaxID=117680 RepID=UPI0015A01354|nr:hypothetical protein [Pseudomonas reactans]NWF17027.1 hypothetical protein [Pseudomonas reactans]
MVTLGSVSDSLSLSERLLEDIEMGTSTLTSIALKASRLARLIGNIDIHEIMLCEVHGYPERDKQKTTEGWRLAGIAKRTYKATVDGVEKTYGEFETIEELEYEIEALKARMPVLAGINLTHSNNRLKTKIRDLGKRRAYIHNFVANVYFELKFSAVASDVFERTRVKVDRRVGELIPQAVKKFTAVYDNLLSKNDEDWSNAVHSCRRILQDAADVLYPARENKIIASGKKTIEVKLGVENYINRLVAYVEENSDSTRFEAIVGSHIKYLGERLDSIFQAAQKGSHNVITSQDEADRYVIYTYLIIGDILELKHEMTEEAPFAPEQ